MQYRTTAGRQNTDKTPDKIKTVEADGRSKIKMHTIHGASSEFPCRDKFSQTAPRQYHIRYFTGQIRAIPERYSGIGGRQRGRIVDAVSNHYDTITVCFQILHYICLVGRKNLREVFFYIQTAGHGGRTAFIISAGPSAA